MSAVPEKDIRIGTLVSCGMKAPAYIQQIQQHGFESYSLTFWQTLEGIDLKKLAKEVKAVLADRDAVISSLAVFGNPLEDGEKDKATLAGWKKCIDAA
ncbi:MAG: sugar phosphate isomerase/epimerase, partial [Kiritimatiellia bacterium]